MAALPALCQAARQAGQGCPAFPSPSSEAPPLEASLPLPDLSAEVRSAAALSSSLPVVPEAALIRVAVVLAQAAAIRFSSAQACLLVDRVRAVGYQIFVAVRGRLAAHQ